MQDESHIMQDESRIMQDESHIMQYETQVVESQLAVPLTAPGKWVPLRWKRSGRNEADWTKGRD